MQWGDQQSEGEAEGCNYEQLEAFDHIRRPPRGISRTVFDDASAAASGDQFSS
jgi:hypothetical protein